MDDLFWRAVIGAALLGIAAGPIGCFVLWRRMAYLGSSLAEMALLGIALGLLLGLDPLVGVLVTSLVAALVLARPWATRTSARNGETGQIPTDTRIGLVGHAGLALGFIVLATMETVRVDLLGYLFGDVLAIGIFELALIGVVAVSCLVVIYLIWEPLLADTISPEILAAEESPRIGARTEAIFLVVVAAFIAFGLKVVGALLVVALLIIPAAAARPFARTPEQMALVAALLAACASPLGLSLAFAIDAPAGPSIVGAALLLFVVSRAATYLLRR